MFQALKRQMTRSGTAYFETGSGDETVVLTHGVGMRIEAWQPQLHRLSEDARVVAVDLPGHGRSAELDGAARLEDFVQWFVRFLDELAIGGASIAGHSMGALIAAGTVATAAQKVRRLALLNGMHKRNAAARLAVKARADEIANGTFDREAPLDRWFSPGERAGRPYALVKDIFQSVNVQGYATAYRAFAEGDSIYSNCWPRVRCPALFLTGALDFNSTLAMSREMAAMTLHGTAVIIPGQRHMVNLTAPDAVNTALLEWLGREATAIHEASWSGQGKPGSAEFRSFLI
jgi:pimeloyl-ACP methyl ester carboxylesterase